MAIENLTFSFSFSVTDDDASSCSFAEFSSKWRTGFLIFAGDV
jgi:hypothetical protein